MNDEVRKTLAGLNATHCLPVDTRYPTRIEALRAAVERIIENKDADATGNSIETATANPT